MNTKKINVNEKEVPTMRRGRINWLAVIVIESLFLLLLSYSTVRAEGGLLRLGRKTLGGALTFSDEVVYKNWRIQKHVVIGHHRLIDPDDVSHARGSFEHCLEEFEKIKAEKKLGLMPKKVVIVLHGLGGFRKYMEPLSEYLEEEGGYTVVNVGYPLMGEISVHADTLANVINHLDGVEEVSFVAHSMGNLVIRHCLQDFAELPASEQPEITYKRFVMIAPPNHGAVAADKLGGTKLAKMVVGDAADQLAPSRGWPTLENSLATPDFEFGIIVGGQGDDQGYLKSIPGDDDMLLSVETSKLVGATDFTQVQGIHQTLPKNEQVQSYVLRYLDKGAFMPSGRRHPIVDENAGDETTVEKNGKRAPPKQTKAATIR